MFILLMIAMGVLLGIFWLWMFIDVIIKQSEDKIVWLLVVFFLNALGAILYYFLARKKRLAAASGETPRMEPRQASYANASTSTNVGCGHWNEVGSAFCGARL